VAEQVVVNHDAWPPEGRIGRCRSGEYEGSYVLVIAEIEDYWATYVSEPHADDFVTQGDDYTQALLDSMDIEWVPREADTSIEEEMLGLRSHWRSEGRI
jgi:hypothetical protein